jgi:hypothetical protein
MRIAAIDTLKLTEICTPGYYCCAAVTKSKDFSKRQQWQETKKIRANLLKSLD